MSQTLIDCVHHFIIGALASGVVMAVGWLVTGSFPPPWVVWAGGAGLIFAVIRLHRLRMRREAARLTEQYDRPAYGEEDNR